MIKVREERMSGELLKHHLEGLPFSSVYHEFTGKDKGQPHDHPFKFRSFILSGSYIERRYFVRPDGTWYTAEYTHKQGDSFVVEAEAIHQLIELPEGTCWTNILHEEKVREPRFWDFSEKIAKSRQWNEEEWK